MKSLFFKCLCALALLGVPFTEGVAQCACTDCRCADSLELVRLYNATNGAGWTVRNENGTTSPWVLSQPMTTWYGVNLTNGRVTNIFLSSIQLIGTIPNFNLPNLRQLSLSNNQLSGSIPNFNLPNLQELYLNNNQLSGTIPNFNLPNLQPLDLSRNQLSGTIPNFNLPNLTILFLGRNQLSGSIPNFNLPNLALLNLSDNQLSGSIPNFNLPNLRTLSFSNNQLSGTIPNFNLPNLLSLSLYSNQLSGTIPNFNLPNLIGFNLGINQLSGTIPDFNLPNLQELFLYDNQLSGTIPNFNLPNLRYVYLFKNQLSGTIPNFSLPNLQDLYLAYNQLSGTIPNFNLPNLQKLRVSHNQLSSTIPNFNLPNLRWLFLNNNQLNGTIPNFNLPNLVWLWLYNNQLSGSIPNFTLPNLYDLHLYNNQLSGAIPNFNLPNLEELWVSHNQLSGTIPNFQNLTKLTEIYLNNNKLSGCFPSEWQRFCRLRYNSNLNNFIDSSYNITGNPQLAWQGDFQPFCNNEPQIGASCNDSLSTTINDKIQADCTCRGIDTTDCRYKDSLALAALYRATNMQNLPPQYKWNLNQPMTTWYGVTLNANGCVQCLDLDGGAVDCDILNPNPTGIGLTGNLPDSIRLLTNLERLTVQGNTGLGGVLPPNFGSLVNLKHFYAYNCRFTAPFPASFWALPNIESIDLNDNPLNIPFPSEFGSFRKLKELHLCSTGLTGSIPQSLGTLDSLGNLDICDNQLTGSVPTNLTTRSKFQVFQIEKNKLDVLPDFSRLTFGQFFPLWTNFFSIQNNRFTFEDIVPNMPIINRIASTYARQDSVFVDTTIRQAQNTPLSIDLKFDAAMSQNVYRWNKNGSFWRTVNSSNKLIFNSLQPTDAGVYDVQVTNPNAPLLTLQSRKITIVVLPPLCTSTRTTRRDSFCNGATYTFPDNSTATTIGNFTKIATNPNGCADTTIYTLSFIKSLKTNKLDSFCNGSTYTFPDNSTTATAGNFTKILRGANGCFDTTIYNLTFRQSLKTTKRDSFCNGSTYTFPDNSTTTTAGNFTKILRGANGCFDTTIYNLTTRQSLKINRLDSFCNGSVYVFPDNSTTQIAGNFTKILRGSSGCFDTVNFVLSYRTARQRTLSPVFCDSFRLPSGRFVKQAGTYRDSINCDSNFLVKLSLDPNCIKNKVAGSNCETIETALTLGNRDGKNDVLDLPQVVDLERFPQNSIEIFNRWGQKVYTVSPYRRDWSGENQRGGELPNGDYFFVVRVNISDRKCYVGTVHIFR
jgi:gliding motility-associated-like protein